MRSCSAEDTESEMTPSTTVKSSDNPYTPMEQFIAKSMPGHKQNLASVHFPCKLLLSNRF